MNLRGSIHNISIGFFVVSRLSRLSRCSQGGENGAKTSRMNALSRNTAPPPPLFVRPVRRSSSLKWCHTLALLAPPGSSGRPCKPSPNQCQPLLIFKPHPNRQTFRFKVVENYRLGWAFPVKKPISTNTSNFAGQRKNPLEDIFGGQVPISNDKNNNLALK